MEAHVCLHGRAGRPFRRNRRPTGATQSTHNRANQINGELSTPRAAVGFVARARCGQDGNGQPAIIVVRFARSMEPVVATEGGVGSAPCLPKNIQWALVVSSPHISSWLLARGIGSYDYNHTHGLLEQSLHQALLCTVLLYTYLPGKGNRFTVSTNAGPSLLLFSKYFLIT